MLFSFLAVRVRFNPSFPNLRIASRTHSHSSHVSALLQTPSLPFTHFWFLSPLSRLHLPPIELNPGFLLCVQGFCSFITSHHITSHPLSRWREKSTERGTDRRYVWSPLTLNAGTTGFHPYPSLSSPINPSPQSNPSLPTDNSRRNHMPTKDPSARWIDPTMQAQASHHLDLGFVVPKFGNGDHDNDHAVEISSRWAGQLSSWACEIKVTG